MHKGQKQTCRNKMPRTIALEAVLVGRRRVTGKLNSIFAEQQGKQVDALYIYVYEREMRVNVKSMIKIEQYIDRVKLYIYNEGQLRKRVCISEREEEVSEDRSMSPGRYSDDDTSLPVLGQNPLLYLSTSTLFTH